MARGAVSNIVAAGLLILGVVVGATGYYVATTYQTKTITETQTKTLDFTSIETQTSTSISTLILSTTSTATSFVTATSTTSIYPSATNVTVAFVQDDGAYQYEIDYGTNVLTSTPSTPLTVPLTNVFQNEKIMVTAQSVGDRVGETVTVELFVNSDMVAQSTTGTGSDPAMINYTI